MDYSNNTGLPSVSDILNPFEDTRWFTEEHRQRGTFVHGWVCADLLGLFTPPVPEIYACYIESYLLFKPRIKDVVLIERRLTSERGFCGQPDLIARLDDSYNNKVCVLDWKTSVAKYKTWQTRIGGYSVLAKENHLPCEGGATIRLRGDGVQGHLPLVDFFTAQEMKENEIDFLSTLRVFNNVLNYGKIYASYEHIKQEY